MIDFRLHLSMSLASGVLRFRNIGPSMACCRVQRPLPMPYIRNPKPESLHF